MIGKDSLPALGLLFLRVMMGVGIARHGFGKLFEGNMSGFISVVAVLGLPYPAVLGWAAALSEFLAGIRVAVGIRTLLAAALVFATMTVAAFVRHASGPLASKELALAYWTIAGALVLLGPGR